MESDPIVVTQKKRFLDEIKPPEAEKESEAEAESEAIVHVVNGRVFVYPELV